MAHQYMPKIFHDPNKNPLAPPPTFLMYSPLWNFFILTLLSWKGFLERTDMTIVFDTSVSKQIIINKFHRIQYLKNVYIYFLYLGEFSFLKKPVLQNTIHEVFPFVSLKLILRIKKRLSSKFTLKNKTSK